MKCSGIIRKETSSCVIREVPIVYSISSNQGPRQISRRKSPGSCTSWSRPFYPRLCIRNQTRMVTAWLNSGLDLVRDVWVGLQSASWKSRKLSQHPNLDPKCCNINKLEKLKTPLLNGSDPSWLVATHPLITFQKWSSPRDHSNYLFPKIL